MGAKHAKDSIDSVAAHVCCACEMRKHAPRESCAVSERSHKAEHGMLEAGCDHCVGSRMRCTLPASAAMLMFCSSSQPRLSSCSLCVHTMACRACWAGRHSGDSGRGGQHGQQRSSAARARHVACARIQLQSETTWSCFKWALNALSEPAVPSQPHASNAAHPHCIRDGSVRRPRLSCLTPPSVHSARILRA